MNAKIFRVINIRSAVIRHQTHERQISDVLHGRQRQNGRGTGQQGVKLITIMH